MASSEGSAFVAITQLAAGKHVFLRAASAITTVMLNMTSEDAKEQKAAYGRKKSPAYAGKKTITMERPLSGSPQGEMTVLTTLMARIWKLRINNVLLHTNKR
ncbi:hypothetical protein [Prevotella dentalis]|uniref:hypothetical protein n=1 Tax=Prevotella dentalis TaxID=52227 RepID=UPI002659143F|nr:hypothetical protein [Prevotella dentalis]MCF2638189.1 hypothetical protein [Prevotella dentalis]